MSTREPISDPYLRCDEGCTHDLARGVLVDDLIERDGPFPSLWAVSDFSGRGVVFRVDRQAEAA